MNEQEIHDIVTHPMSWSRLKHYSKSPAHFLEAWRNPPEQTPAMLLGSALHCLVLEQDKFWDRYAVAPEFDRRTKDGKQKWTQFQESNADKAILDHDQYEQALGMSVAIRDSKTAAHVLEICSHREDTIHWTDPLTDLPCKGVVDAWGGIFALDIKTTDDAGDKAFGRTAAGYMYHGQAAMYLDGLRENGQDTTHFLFIVVEKKPPYGVKVFWADTEMITAGRALYQRLLEQHALCCSDGVWPGYKDGVHSLSLPAWAA